MNDWERFAVDVYLDRRHRNWIISEEMGDVRFLPEAGEVLVHRVRAEHIVRELIANAGTGRVQAVPARPAPPRAAPATAVRVQAAQAHVARALRVTTLPAPRRPAMAHARRSAAPAPPPAIPALDRWRVLGGWFGLALGMALFVTALAIRLDDDALLLALALLLRGGRLILEDVPASLS